MKQNVLAIYAVVVSVVLLAETSVLLGGRLTMTGKTPPPKSEETGKTRSDYVKISAVTNGDRITAIWDTQNHEIIKQDSFDGDTDRLQATSYLFKGQVVLELHFPTNGAMSRCVLYYNEDGTEKMALLDHTGQGQFSQRFVYGTDGTTTEVWCNDHWYPIRLRDGKKCVLIGEKWYAVKLTNGLWSVDREWPSPNGGGS